MAKGKKQATGVDPVPSVMRIEKGERIVGGWITPEIPGVGMYKLLAKRKADGTCEWVHFIQRSTGKKENFVGGTTRDEKEIEQVIAAVNRSLERVFGPQCRLSIAGSSVFLLDGKRLGDISPN